MYFLIGASLVNQLHWRASQSALHMFHHLFRVNLLTLYNHAKRVILISVILSYALLYFSFQIQFLDETITSSSFVVLSTSYIHYMHTLSFCKYVFLFLFCCRVIRLQKIPSKTIKFNIWVFDVISIYSNWINAIQFA